MHLVTQQSYRLILNSFTTVPPVCPQLQLLEGQVDPEDLVRQSCLVWSHLAF